MPQRFRREALAVCTLAVAMGCDVGRSTRAPAAASAPPASVTAATIASARTADRCSPAVYEATYAASFGALHTLDGSSCTHCHLADVDLLMWEQSSACQTTACYTEIGWFDLDSPLDSKMIDLVQQSEMAGFVNTEPWRYRPQHELDKAVAEYQLLTQWVDYASECHSQACPTYEQPCGEALEYGRCTEDLLVERFTDDVQPWLETAGCVAAKDKCSRRGPRRLPVSGRKRPRGSAMTYLPCCGRAWSTPAPRKPTAHRAAAEGTSVETPFGTATGVVHTGARCSRRRGRRLGESGGLTSTACLQRLTVQTFQQAASPSTMKNQSRVEGVGEGAACFIPGGGTHGPPCIGEGLGVAGPEVQHRVVSGRGAIVPRVGIAEAPSIEWSIDIGQTELVEAVVGAVERGERVLHVHSEQAAVVRPAGVVLAVAGGAELGDAASVPSIHSAGSRSPSRSVASVVRV